jgi:hypothetical protein
LWRTDSHIVRRHGGMYMCVWCLDSSKLTAGKIHDSPAVKELYTAHSDLTFITVCSGMKDPIRLFSVVLVTIRTSNPYISAINHMIYYL